MTATLLLAAYGTNSSSNSEDEYKAALITWYTEHPVCASISDKLPIALSASSTRRAGLDALVEAKLMTSTEIRTGPDRIEGESGDETYIRYQPTKVGESVVRQGANRFLGGTDICFAKRKIVAMKSATAPENLGGIQVSRVTYSWKLEPASLADAPALLASFPEIARALADRNSEATDALVKTEAGWVHIRGIGSNGHSG